MKKRFYHVLLCLTLLLASCALLAVGASAADPMRDFDFARYASDNPDILRARYLPGRAVPALSEPWRSRRAGGLFAADRPALCAGGERPAGLPKPVAAHRCRGTAGQRHSDPRPQLAGAPADPGGPSAGPGGRFHPV